MRSVRAWLVAAVLAVLPGLVPISANAASSPQSDIQEADQLVLTTHQDVSRGDAPAAQQDFQQYLTQWRQIEDAVKAASPADYAAIEAAQRQVRARFQAQPSDAEATGAALDELHAADLHFIGLNAPAQSSSRDVSSDSERLSALVADLDRARAALAQQDPASAVTAVRTFDNDWLAVEVTVKAKSPTAYAQTEDDMATAEALLNGPDPRVGEADAVLVRMHDRLAPIAEAGATYGIFDAFVIILREGLEALLVVGALTAFVRRSGNADKQGWIWGGASVGVALSVGLALVLNQIFSRAGVGLGSELVEGIVGVTAAGMLFYVSYWLHAKSRLGAWQRYIRERSTQAMAGGSMLSLAFIALLAVFREGAETVVFYLGIAPSISASDLLLGLGLGMVALLAIGGAVLLVGLRLPLRPFFLASSLLIYYLGFKFLGTGLHSLQIAGVLPATPAPLPASDVLGVYPTWETAVPQLALLVIAIAMIWISVRQPRQPGTFAAA